MTKKSANSSLPNGGYSMTNGSNYMLDGFQFDTEYNDGVLDRARLPEAKGLSALPSGMIPSDSDGMSDLPDGVEVDLDLDLGDLTREASQSIPLVDHSWLASQPKPDLSGQRSLEDVLKSISEGRFENPEVNQFKKLQDSWGTESTTGLDILPNNQREHEKYKNTYKDVSKLPGDDFKAEQEKLYRKMAYGEPLSEILKTSSDPLAAQKMLSSEYGLLGRVYIKEAHFPGLFNGRWDEVINSRCKTAMYIIPKHKDCAYDRFLGMEVVKSVNDIPWKKVSSQLLPRLESYGVRVASLDSHKEIIRKAFVDLMEGRIARHETSQTWFTIQANEADFISLDHARRKLEAAQEEHTYIASQEEVHETKLGSKLKRVASQLEAQGFLDKEVIESVMGTDKTAQAKMDRLYELASQPSDAGAYEGTGMGVHAHTPTKSKIATEFKTRSELTFEQRVATALSKLDSLVSTHMVTAKEVEAIATKYKSEPEQAVRVAFERAAYNMRTDGVGAYQGEGSGVTLLTTKTATLKDSDLASLDHARRKLEANRNGKIKTRGEITLAEREQKSLERVAHLIKAGLISHDEVSVAIKGAKTPEAKVASVCEFIARPKQASTYGDYDLKEHRMVKQHKKLDKVPDRQKRASASLWKEAHAKVDKLVEGGLLSKTDYESIQSVKEANEYVRRAFELASRPVQASAYVGEETAHIITPKASSRVSDTEKKVATWLRQKMSEGSAGDELNVLLATRFSQQVLDTYQSRIASLREAHEGISGHAYVDAEAYMTSGTEGCDKGALVHRANQIPTLLAVSSKCASCVFNTEGTCQKYNKVLVSSPAEVVEDLSSFQRENIRLANGTDADRTASLFVNDYDPNEFGLESPDDIDVEDAPDNKSLGDVLFGGFEV